MTLSEQTPKGIAVYTQIVHEDEPCFYLGEVNRMSADSKTLGRYQILKVVRQDSLVTACVYLGPSANFTADQFQMIGGTIDEKGRGQAMDTVGSMRSDADQLRDRDLYRPHEPTDLQEQFTWQVEEKQRRAKHASTFGSHTNLVRP